MDFLFVDSGPFPGFLLCPCSSPWCWDKYPVHIVMGVAHLWESASCLPPGEGHPAGLASQNLTGQHEVCHVWEGRRELGGGGGQGARKIAT